MVNESVEIRRFNMDSRYEQEVKKFGKKDAVIALCVLAVLMGVLVLVALVSERATDFQSTIMDYALRIVLVGTAVTIVLVKKQGLASIGFHKDKLWPMLRFGLILILIFLVFGIVPGLIFGWEFNGMGAIIPALLTTLFMAAGEDIFFVGYLQTRLYGLIKNNALAILAGAVFFALVHLPAAMILAAYPFGALTGVFVWILGHSFVVLIFRRHFSIITVIIVHTLANFFSGGSIWSEFNIEYSLFYSGTVPILSVLVVLVILEIVRWRKAKKWTKEAKNEGVVSLSKSIE